MKRCTIAAVLAESLIIIMTRVEIVKNKRIGKVLFIVEGIKTEINILRNIFTQIFDYQYEKRDRLDKYVPYNKKENSTSSVFVINTKESNIKDIKDADGYLDDLFIELINKYDFPVDNATIYYLFDRDKSSNTDKEVIKELISKLSNAKESINGWDRPGLLLLSYPSVESFVASNYIENCFEIELELGKELKQFLHERHINYQHINSETLKKATLELNKALDKMGLLDYDLDNFESTNLEMFNFEENNFEDTKKYRIFSSLCLALIDLGLITITEDEEI